MQDKKLGVVHEGEDHSSEINDGSNFCMIEKPEMN